MLVWENYVFDWKHGLQIRKFNTNILTAKEENRNRVVTYSIRINPRVKQGRIQKKMFREVSIKCLII